MSIGAGIGERITIPLRYRVLGPCLQAAQCLRHNIDGSIRGDNDRPYRLLTGDRNPVPDSPRNGDAAEGRFRCPPTSDGSAPMLVAITSHKQL
jgi:hypothetical protein